MSTVHWVGAGLSTSGPGLRALADRVESLVVWGRDAARLAGRMRQLGLQTDATAAVLADDALARALRPGDVLVSMAPAAEHPSLLRIALDAGAHFACTSYVSPELEAMAAAADPDTVVMTETGLDPGIDHLMAHHLVELATEAVGPVADQVRFTSYCGGIPEVPGEFRYQFSWAPVGVLTALAAPATYRQGGRDVTAERPWQATSTHQVGGETFEVYPNRDSLPFIDQYHLPQGWALQEFVRGTLRPAGWRNAWSEVFDVVTDGDRAQIAALAQELAERYPTGPDDRDRVVLVVRLQAGSWQGEYTLDLVGDDEHSAMARCVTLPLTLAVEQIVAGRLEPGLHRAVAADGPGASERWLAELTAQGLPIELSVTQH